MSTKTTIKRIALVAVAALGLGMLSSVPSNAATVGYSLAVDANDTANTLESATAVLTLSYYSSTPNDSVTVRAVNASNNSSGYSKIRIALTDSSTSAGTCSTAATNCPTVTTASASAAGTNMAALDDQSARGDSFTVFAGTTGVRQVNATFSVTMYNISNAGTYNIDFYTFDAFSGATQVGSTVPRWVVTVTATSRVANGSSTLTARQYVAGQSAVSPFGGTKEGTDSTTVATKSSTRTTPDFTVYVLQKNALLNAAESFTATVTGNAYIQTGTTRTSANATALTMKAEDTVSGTTATPIYVYSNGTAGTATVSVTTASGLAMGSKTFTFTGLVTGIAVDSRYYTPMTIARAGGYTTSSMFYVRPTDANGKTITGQSFATTLTSDATAVASVSVGSYDADYDAYPVDVTTSVGSTSGQSSTLTFRVVDPSITTSTAYLTTTQVVTLGGSPLTVTLSLDASSYTPGQAMVITATAKDSKGNPVYDGASVPTLTANKALSATISLTGHGALSGKFAGGKASSISIDTDSSVLNATNLFAPAAEGTFMISGTFTGSDLATKFISVEASVGGGSQDALDAANEATDAANAATDAANAAAEAADAATAAAQDAQAAVAELATQVASLIAGIKAQITTLTNLVIKIQKKVKA